METPRRPITVRASPQQRSSQASGSRADTVRTAVFPSPPVTRATFSQQQQQPRHTGSIISHSSNHNTIVNSSANNVAAMPRSTSAPSLLPGPSAIAGPQPATSHQQPSYGAPSKRGPTTVSPAGRHNSRKTLVPTAVAPVPINTKLAMEARKATMAKRLRVNLVLLLSWYLITDSRLYGYGARELVFLYPLSKMVLVWFIDRLLPLLFLYNASEAFLRIRWVDYADRPASNVTIPLAPAQQPLTASRPTASATTPSRVTPISIATYKSSPKTRPSVGAVPSPSLTAKTYLPATTAMAADPGRAPPPAAVTAQFRMFRAALGSKESPTAALRRSLLTSANTPPASPHSTTTLAGIVSSPIRSMNSSPLLANASAPTSDFMGPRVQAYWARHEPVVSELHKSISAKADLDRLLSGAA
ncbi:MAG: hypothetical protein CYPHOPRED_002455 [Cyphobasidiales sp. Tagirdzhanova-0007]|nr:MAG: hypothetical protein CYPHOPRED_002455 [Cyphobasidiales sp. Tagirdzhanova-0007]